MRISREKIEHCAVEAGRRTIHFGEAAGRRIRRFSRRTWIIIVIVAVVVAGGLYWLLKPAPPQPVYPIVEVEPVQTSDMEIYGDYVGRIRAQQFVEIRARVEGFLEKMLFEEGTYVKKNQPLFIIDPKLYRARVNKARAQLNKDKALELKAERDLNRIRPLYDNKAASQLDLDNAIAAYESATGRRGHERGRPYAAETAVGIYDRQLAPVGLRL